MNIKKGQLFVLSGLLAVTVASFGLKILDNWGQGEPISIHGMVVENDIGEDLPSYLRVATNDGETALVVYSASEIIFAGHRMTCPSPKRDLSSIKGGAKVSVHGIRKKFYHGDGKYLQISVCENPEGSVTIEKQ